MKGFGRRFFGAVVDAFFLARMATLLVGLIGLFVVSLRQAHAPIPPDTRPAVRQNMEMAREMGEIGAWIGGGLIILTVGFLAYSLIPTRARSWRVPIGGDDDY